MLRFSLRFLSVCAAVFLTCHSGYAQSAGSRLGCKDPIVRKQADDIKQHYLGQGFEVMRDAMITMDSQIPFPIQIELHRGELYQIVFVANAAAQRLKLELYNSADELIGERTSLKDQPNYIVMTYSPERNELYFLSIMQRLKNKEGLCGSLCVLRQTGKQATVTPYSGPRPSPTVE